MKTILTALIGLFFILTSCKSDEERSNEIDNNNFKDLSYYELEKIGFEKIEDPETFNQGMQYLEEAAFKGSSSAAREVGLRYARGNGVTQDKWKAQSFLQKVSYEKDCQFELGRIYFEEATMEYEYKKAYECFSSLTYGDYDNYAEYMLGYMNYYGLGTLKDYKSAYNYFEASTKRPNSDTLYGADILGLGDARYYLGIMALEGQGCKKDYALAESHFSKCFYSNACKYMLGFMHYNGLCKRSSKNIAAMYIKQVYEIEGFNELDREFNSKARQFWEEHELWKYSE